MRADARRNRDRLLDAAIELLLEVGAEPPFDAIARRADVGIATLYRHFPDRERLEEAVARHTLAQSIEAADTALRNGRDGYEALREYMHAAVRRGVGVLNLIRPRPDDADWRDQRTRMTTLLTTILEQGKADGRLRQETRIPDVVFPIIRFSRPVEVGLSRADERAIAHRHLDVFIDGLGTGPPTDRSVPEPPVLGRWAG